MTTSSHSQLVDLGTDKHGHPVAALFNGTMPGALGAATPSGMQFEHCHPATGRPCVGYISWHPEEAESARWDLHSLEPLTVTPSLLCNICGLHGFITDGRWRDC